MSDTSYDERRSHRRHSDRRHRHRRRQPSRSDTEDHASDSEGSPRRDPHHDSKAIVVRDYQLQAPPRAYHPEESDEEYHDYTVPRDHDREDSRERERHRRQRERERERERERQRKQGGILIAAAVVLVSVIFCMDGCGDDDY